MLRLFEFMRKALQRSGRTFAKVGLAQVSGLGRPDPRRLCQTTRPATSAFAASASPMMGRRVVGEMKSSKQNAPLDEANDMLKWCIRKLFRDVGTLAERRSLPFDDKSVAAELTR